VLQIPKIVQEKARVEGVSSWIDSLPAVVEQVAAEWNLTVGAVLTGGTESQVIETTTESGDLAVLKLVVPRRQYGSTAESQLQRSLTSPTNSRRSGARPAGSSARALSAEGDWSSSIRTR
jgi:hypothetical protein